MLPPARSPSTPAQRIPATPAGLSVEEIAERPYDEREVWDSNKNFLYIALGIIGLVVAAYYFFQQSEQEDSSKRSEAFVKASMETEGARGSFLVSQGIRWYPWRCG